MSDETAVGDRPIDVDFYLDPSGRWVYRWSDERRVLMSAGSVEYAVRCGRMHWLYANTGLAEARHVAAEFDSERRPDVTCGPHHIVSRYVTPWQEEKG